MFTVVVATLAVNIAANVVSPANDFANAFPKWISFRTGGLITGIIGILIQPWRLLADPSGYIFGWLVGYSGGLGFDRRRADRRLLDRAGSGTWSSADLYRVRGVYTRMELAGGRRDRSGLLFCLDRPDNFRTSPVVRLRLVCRIWSRVFRPLGVDDRQCRRGIHRRRRYLE